MPMFAYCLNCIELIEDEMAFAPFVIMCRYYMHVTDYKEPTQVFIKLLRTNVPQSFKPGDTCIFKQQNDANLL